MFGMLAIGWQLPGPRSSVNCVNVKLNSSGLASGSMPGKCSSRVRVRGNFTPLPKLASSVSFFSAQRGLFPGTSLTGRRLRAAMDGAAARHRCGLCDESPASVECGGRLQRSGSSIPGPADPGYSSMRTRQRQILPPGDAPDGRDLAAESRLISIPNANDSSSQRHIPDC